MADVCSSSSSEQESYSNESFGLSASDGFSTSSSYSSENSQTGRGKSAALSRFTNGSTVLNLISVLSSKHNSFIQRICMSVSNRGNQFLAGRLKLQITLSTPVLVALV